MRITAVALKFFWVLFCDGCGGGHILTKIQMTFPWNAFNMRNAFNNYGVDVFLSFVLRWFCWWSHISKPKFGSNGPTFFPTLRTPTDPSFSRVALNAISLKLICWNHMYCKWICFDKTATFRKSVHSHQKKLWCLFRANHEPAFRFDAIRLVIHISFVNRPRQMWCLI